MRDLTIRFKALLEMERDKLQQEIKHHRLQREIKHLNK
jgi:hypothetical protein